MYRFERKITVKNVADMPAAMQFANDVTDYLNKRYDLHMQYGAEGFDKSRVHWFYDFDSADKSAALGQTLLKDQEYNTLLNKAKGLWLEGASRTRSSTWSIEDRATRRVIGTLSPTSAQASNGPIRGRSL
jgi:hypothetical protein